MAALIRGDFAAADATIGWVRARAAELAPGTRIALELAAALHHLLAGEYEAGLTAARAGLAAGEAEGLRACDGWLHIVAAAAALAADDPDGARAELQALVADGVQLCRGDRALVHYVRAWLAALEGDAGGAQREAKVALAVAVETGIPWLECLARLAVVQTHSASGDRRGAEAQARAAASIAERLASPLAGFGAALAAAAAAHEAKDDPAALEALAGAFAIGREHGFRGVLGWRPQALAELCAAALAANIEPDFARTLVRARRLVPPASARRIGRWPWPFRIVTLGGFQLERDGTPIEFAGKGPGRPLELLKVLVALGGKNVRADHLGDALWPHVDADYAHKSFTATLHRLRRMLEDDDALLHRDGRLSLNPGLAWVDTWALEDVLEALDAQLRAPGPHADSAAARSLVEEALALYRGPYLPDETEQPGYIACRDQLRARLLRPLARIAREWEEAGKADLAIDCYLRCIDADEVWEACYRHLMRCYQRASNPIAALETFERLRTTLAARLKTEPAPETQAIQAGLKSAG
jgi:DNA-binding SARP family transcriptional activator